MKTNLLNTQYIIIRNFGLSDWYKSYIKMNYFTNIRNKFTLDEIWLLEHYPIFTTGQINHNNKNLYIKNIPLMNSNRGGKITYHGPGQQIVYFLIDLKRLQISIKKFLYLIDQIILNTLYYFSIIGHKRNINPGIYVNNKKICSIGFRIKKCYSLHGLALNIITDLQPFKYIYPCGKKNIKMTNMFFVKKNYFIQIVKKILIKKISFFFNIKIYMF